jgi:hypothetical protein
MHSRSGHRGGLQLAVRSQHLVHRSETLATKLAGHGVRSAYIGIDHSQQAHRFALLFEFLVNSGMIAPKDANAYHSDGNRAFRGQ